MMIEIDGDVADKIVQTDLAETYAWLMNDIKAHTKGTRKLHEDDFEMYHKVAAAIEVLGDWYFVPGEFKKAVKKVKVK
jgi:hypothetical protein